MVQHIRGSQYIYTYGPGSIIETKNGPRLVPSPRFGLFIPGRDVTLNHNLELADPRIHALLQSQNNSGRNLSIFRLPSNAELDRTSDYSLYLTKKFPEWKLCNNPERHRDKVLYKGRSCPRCREDDHKNAIRFVMACRNGHLDDVNWSALIHSSEQDEDQPSEIICNNDSWFWWRGGGQSLHQVRLRCNFCKSEINFGQKYRDPLECTGRFPEREAINSSSQNETCNESAYIQLRQASNLRIPEIKTILSISHRAILTELNDLLQGFALKMKIKMQKRFPHDKIELEAWLDELMEDKMIDPSVKNGILNYSWNEILATYNVNNNLLNSVLNYDAIINDEFLGLMDASINGAPPVSHKQSGRKVLFEVDPNKRKFISTKNRNNFIITPIQRLRTISIQPGYRRIIGEQDDPENQPELIPVGHFDHNTNTLWYPGVQSFGEGIFIRLENDEGFHFNLKGTHANEWKKAFENTSLYNEMDYLFRSTQSYYELNPVFIWWHTLSHVLIREISLYSGYSSASIRERIYLETTEKGTRGAIILYATQRGTDGTLGGLLSLVPSFEMILENAMSSIEICSSDPLCANSIFSPSKHSGASCYACTLVSETSCEHRNLWLDRNIVRDNPV